jgi:hypothetical protein
VSEEEYRQLHTLAVAAGKSINALVVELLRNELQELSRS